MERTRLATAELGATGMRITPVGVGARINSIDTAAALRSGRSEQVVGRALEGVADRPYVDPILVAANLELSDDDIDEIIGRAA